MIFAAVKARTKYSVSFVAAAIQTIDTNTRVGRRLGSWDTWS